MYFEQCQKQERRHSYNDCTTNSFRMLIPSTGLEVISLALAFPTFWSVTVNLLTSFDCSGFQVWRLT